MHWRRLATPRGRSWWVLSTSELRTDEAGCGSSLPTPQKADATKEGRPPRLKTDRESRDPTLASSYRADLTDVLAYPDFLPTPTATDYGSNRGGSASRTGKVRPSLGYLPTPRKSDADRGGRGDLIQAIRGNENKHFRNHLLPTPRSGDDRRGADPTSHSPNLKAALLPTPTVGDSRNSRNATAHRTDPDSKHHPGTTLSACTHGRVGTADRLALIEWMMGYPPKWIERASFQTAPLPRFRRRRREQP